MKQAFLLIILLVLGFPVVKAQEKNSALWEKGNKAYQAKQYDTAIACYEQLLARQPANAQVYYNLGNAWYKNNQVSKAVLNYEKALFYDPAMQQAKDNLILAKNRIPNTIKPVRDIFFIRWWKTLTAGHTTNEWAARSLLVFLLLLSAIVLQYGRQRRKIPVQFYFFIPLLLLLFVYCAFLSAYHATHSTKAVVMVNAAALTPAPGVYKGQSLIPEATTVETGEKKGNWIAVTLPDNRTGWMQQSELIFVQASVLK